MPRRTKIDRAPILEALCATGGDRVATAALTGIHYNTVTQIDRLSRGFCSRCGVRKHQPEMTKCGPCADWERNRTARKRKDARAIQQCSMCPKPLRKGSTLYCEDHYWQTLKRQRIHRLNDRYGPIAIDVWNEADETCAICGSKHAKSNKVHLHHIDEDHANGSRKNLIVICWHCHRLVHLLLTSKNLQGLLAWFSRTYPSHPIR